MLFLVLIGACNIKLIGCYLKLWLGKLVCFRPVCTEQLSMLSLMLIVAACNTRMLGHYLKAGLGMLVHFRTECTGQHSMLSLILKMACNTRLFGH
jgi:hypothetical protein